MDSGERYGYVSVDYNLNYWVTLKSTEPKLLDWLVSELKKFVPECRVQGSLEDLSGEICWVDVVNVKWTKKRKGIANRAAFWWIIRQLCHQGWEPFASDDYSMALRKRLQP